MAGKDKVKHSIANTEIKEAVEDFAIYINEYLDKEHANVASFTAITDWNKACASHAQFVKEAFSETSLSGRINVIRKMALQNITMFALLASQDTNSSEQEKALAKGIIRKAKMKFPEEVQDTEMDALSQLMS